VATAEFSKFAGILSAALSQHHLSGFEIAPLECHHLQNQTWVENSKIKQRKAGRKKQKNKEKKIIKNKKQRN